MAAKPNTDSVGAAEVVCGFCRGVGHTEEGCIWAHSVIEENPYPDAAAQHYASQDPSLSHRESIRRYYLAQRTLPMLSVVMPGRSDEEVSMLARLASPEGQATVLSGIAHRPGSLVARPVQSRVVYEVGAWRRATGRGPSERRFWALREVLLSTPAFSR